MALSFGLTSLPTSLAASGAVRVDVEAQPGGSIGEQRLGAKDDARERNREVAGSCEGMATLRGLEMKRPVILAALVATAAVGLAAAIPADAAVSSASID